uniref:NADH dehydrogenase subunit 6 n=2 Tax=Fasciola TaxID=6191 RepID=A0A4P8PF87_FASGI|nr:NADH dehydrogenase subunit 6 [Fasciola sp. GHL-2014]QCQ81671.1 NADH dehydrogenase subunit 6 [Fasciola gigantica]WKD80470.1 NADH dehydrogenase subunit 6 [Fasciola gigantica]
MLSAILASVYFSCLLGFSFVSHPVVYCLLLIGAALSISGLGYLVVGFSWYLVVFCLVYVGGVYVLFIFVSIHTPNPLPNFSGIGVDGLVLFFGFLCVFAFTFFSVPSLCDSSFYLCSSFEGVSYCLFCLVLMVGFVCVSVVVSSGGGFFR